MTPGMMYSKEIDHVMFEENCDTKIGLLNNFDYIKGVWNIFIVILSFRPPRNKSKDILKQNRSFNFH